MRALLPREHALWAWVLVPLAAAAALAPASLPAGLAVLAGFLASNGLGARLRGSAGATKPAALAGLAAALAGALGLWASAAPSWTLGTLLTAGALGLGTVLATRGTPPRAQALEALGVVGLAAAGLGLALGAGAPLPRAAVAEGVVATWGLLGLVWVNRTLAGLLKHRVPWPQGPLVAVGAAAGSLGLGLAFGAPIAALPLLYPLRVVAHAPPSSARDLRRLGLTELGWALAAGVTAALVA